MSTAGATVDKPMRHRDIAFSAAGAVVEWYDFMLFAYLAPVLAHVFFPDSGGLTALLSTLTIYAAGFLMGPIGGFVFGSLGDRLGRKWTLTASITLMIIPMTITTFLPGYAAIGILAPLLLTICRLMQGFSVGGQYGGTMVVMVESAPGQERGRVASYATMTSGIGVLMASAVATGLALLTTDEQMEAWGWRAGYAFGTVLVIAVFFMRRSMTETEAFDELKESGTASTSPVRDTWRHERGPLLKSIAIAGYANVVYYVVASYLPTQLTVINGEDQGVALLYVSIASLIFAATAPWWGKLSDRFGRMPPLWLSAGMLLVVSIPAFLLFDLNSVLLVSAGFLLLLIPLMAIWGSYGALSPELFSARYRYTGTSISYNLGNSIFGGLAPLTAVGLIAITGWDWSPALLLVVASVVMLPILRFVPETARRTLT